VLNAPVSVDSMVAMFNFDMIGNLRGRRLQLRAMESSRDWDGIIDSVGTPGRLGVERIKDPDPFQARSDHQSFSRMGVPVLHFFTGTHGAYHTSEDTVRDSI
jgi:Zn-dependent M28 family amino/carboxypeptidase